VILALAFGFTSAANSELLPQPKPQAVRAHIVVPMIGSRKVACAQRSRVWDHEDALQPLDFSNGLFNAHPLYTISQLNRLLT
jgi:hypothetical protein